MMVGDAIGCQGQRLQNFTEARLNSPELFNFCAFIISAGQRRIYEYEKEKEESKAMQKDKAKEKGPYRNKLTPSA